MKLDLLKTQWRWILGLFVGFISIFYLPVGTPRFNQALLGACELLKSYAREHVLLCLVPALFIAGAVGVFISHGSILKYLGPKANKIMAYLTASVAGTVLAVCSCTILPLFAGIHRRGAGLGPAIAFLYSGPAINIMAIVMTARVLGVELGTARAVGAVSMSIIIGLSMQFIFREEGTGAEDDDGGSDGTPRPMWQSLLFFGSMIAILVFANWTVSEQGGSVYAAVGHIKWQLTTLFAVLLAVILVMSYRLALPKMIMIVLPVAALAFYFPHVPLLAFTAGFLGLGFFTATADEGELREWFEVSWDFAKKILPLLFIGVFVAALLLGRADHEGLIPERWIVGMVGGNSLWANFCASLAGAFMYFATLTEVPIVEGLLIAGMGKGPALALLLAGPALSLPSMLVIGGVLGFRKTTVFVALVVIFSTLGGFVFGLMKG